MNENTSIAIIAVAVVFFLGFGLRGCQDMINKDSCFKETKSAECMK